MSEMTNYILLGEFIFVTGFKYFLRFMMQHRERAILDGRLRHDRGIKEMLEAI